MPLPARNTLSLPLHRFLSRSDPHSHHLFRLASPSVPHAFLVHRPPTQHEETRFKSHSVVTRLPSNGCIESAPSGPSCHHRFLRRRASDTALTFVTPTAPVNSQVKGHRGFCLGALVIPLALMMIVVAATHHPGGMRRRAAETLQAVVHGTWQKVYARESVATSAGKPQKGAEPCPRDGLLGLASSSPSAVPSPPPGLQTSGGREPRRGNTVAKPHQEYQSWLPTEFRAMIPQIPYLTSSVPSPPILTLPPKLTGTFSSRNRIHLPTSPKRGKDHSLKKLLIGSN